MNNNNKYIKGIFARKGVNKYNTPTIEISFNDEFIRELKDIKRNDKGFGSFTLTQQHKDPNKYSATPSEAYPARENTNQ